MRSTAEAGPHLIDLALRKAHPKERGHFELEKKVESSPDSLNEEKQDLIWNKTLEWAGLTKGEIGSLI